MTADRVFCIFTVCLDDSRSLATSIQLQPTAHLHLNELISNGLSVLNAYDWLDANTKFKTIQPCGYCIYTLPIDSINSMPKDLSPPKKNNKKP